MIISDAPSNLSRRDALRVGALTAAATLLTDTAGAKAPTESIQPDWKVTKGRIRQSVMGWCFKQQPAPLSTEDLAKACRDIGIVAMEGISASDYPIARKYGLEISLISGGHGFKKGPFNRENHPFVIEKLREGIDLAAREGVRNVITFTGMREPGISDATGEKNCLDAWKSVLNHAEQKNVTLVLEHLNSVDDTHPMKGHPGYFGDDVDHCVDMIRKIGSPNFRLLFDIYHVQIMNGDVIRRIRKYREFIAHYHTAGNPGRAELDRHQEINYPPILEAILETGYKGYVAQEFIPTWDDKIGALRHAAKVCDV
jgi:hydroxypyruvate isomerase